jgi:TPR repeat protein
MRRTLLIGLLTLIITACATMPTTYVQSELAQSQRYFDEGYYKKAMQQLIPLACHGNAQAQYAIGYMYYYGLGVAQDTDVGYQWMKQAADQGYQPAKDAIASMVGTDGVKR